MPDKVRSHKQLTEIKGIVRTMWLISGFSVRKIAREFNGTSEYVKDYGTVSISSVGIWVKEIRRDSEKWLDEDALEKYTGEFVRQQHIIEARMESLQDVQKYINFETGDVKDKELYLKFEKTIHEMSMDKIKLMTDIELVLRIKKLNKDRRLKNETLVLVDKDGKPLKGDIKSLRGYKEIENKPVGEHRISGKIID